MRRLPYKALLDLGFKRNECLSSDEVWFNEFGYNCFYLEKYLQKDINLQWFPDTGKIEMIRYKSFDPKDGEPIDILDRREITWEEMESFIKVFEREGDIKKPEYICRAC